MIILFGDGVAEIFSELPEQDKREAAVKLDLLAQFPRMCPVRRLGVMKGYRYFLAGRHLFYYTVAGEEVRLSAIIPAVMRLA